MAMTVPPIEDLKITVAPTWSAQQTQNHMDLETPGLATSPYDDGHGDDIFPGGLSFQFAEPYTPDHVAEQIVAALAASGLHEGLEWVMIDGERLAEPHPMNEDEMWDWLMERMTALVQEYRERYSSA
jgi:hypothetical protein